MAKRPYEQRLRAETAAETKQRILHALAERLREAPAEPVTVEEIARRARVARSTIYLAFGSRTGLFDAFTKELLAGTGYDRIIRAVRDPDARVSLRGGIEGGVEMYAAHHQLFRTLAAMARLDPAGVGQAIDRSEQERARGMANLARRLHEQRLLRPGVSQARAAHVIWVLASFDAFDTLAAGRRLAPAEAAEILVEMAERSLLDPAVLDAG